MNYPDSVHFLYALGNEVKTFKLGLDRMRALLAALGDPQNATRWVHVAGTNGKGSTCAMIESGLRRAGTRTGLFTSPHLVEPTERIRLRGVPVTHEQFAAAFGQVHAAAEQLVEEGVLELHPTYFETVTAMAFLIFAGQADIGVLEVGLGGRLDATNVVMPELAVITPVDFDHEALLGRGIEAIAGEKAGILKSGVPAIFAAQRPEAAAVLERRAAELGIEVVRVSDWPASSLEVHPRGSRFVARGMRIECPLAGEHQVENALTAAAALSRLGIAPEAIADGIAATRWPGRLERVSDSPEIVLDGAHNPAGARALARYIRRFYEGRRVRLIYAAMRDKAVEEMTAILFPLAADVIATAPGQARAVRPVTIRELSDHPGIRTAPDLSAALELVRRDDSCNVTFITGSLFLVGEARALLL